MDPYRSLLPFVFWSVKRCDVLPLSIHQCNPSGLSTGQLYNIRSSVIWPFRLSVVSESRGMFPKPHIVMSLMTFMIFVVLCGFVFCWAFTALQALTSLLVLLCISTLRDEDRVTWEAHRSTASLALQSMTFGRHRNGAAAWPFLSDPKHPCVSGCTLLCHKGHVSVRRYFRIL